MPSAPDQYAAVALRRAAVRATLAPSVRNTQPWHFVLSGSALEIHADWGRRLPVIDRHGRQLLISCGAAILNARVSLAAAGYETVVDRYPDPLRPDLVTRLTVGNGRPYRLPLGVLDSAVEERHSNRHDFTDEPVPVALVDELAVAARAESAELVALASTADRLAAARLTIRADSLERADPAYRAEMRAWAAGDPRSRDGVPSLPAPDHGAAPGTDTRGTGWLTLDPAASSGHCLLVLGSTRDTPLGWVSVGEALERILLEITRWGYVASPLTQAIEVEETNALLRGELRLTMQPGLLLRVGRAPATVAARRRRLVDLIEEVAA